MADVRSTQFWQGRIVPVTPAGSFNSIYTVPGGRTGLLKRAVFWNTHPSANGKLDLYVRDSAGGWRQLIEILFVAPAETTTFETLFVLMAGQEVEVVWTVFNPVPAACVTTGSGALLLGVPT